MTRGTIILISVLTAFVLAVLAICSTVLMLRFGDAVFGSRSVAPAPPGIQGEMFLMNGTLAAPQAGRAVYLLPIGFTEVFAAEQLKAEAFRSAIPPLEAEAKRLETDLEQAEEFESSLRKKQAEASRWENEARRVEKVLGDFRIVGYNAFNFLNPLSGKQVRVAFEDARPGTSLGRWKEDTAARLNAVVGQCRARAKLASDAGSEMEAMRRPEALQDLRTRLAEINREITTTRSGAIEDDHLVAALVSRTSPVAVTVTDMEGHFRLEAPPGEYELVAWSAGGDIWLEPVTISPSGVKVSNLSNANRRR